MAKRRKPACILLALVLCAVVFANTEICANAGSSNNHLGSMTGGMSAILNPGVIDAVDIIAATAEELHLDPNAIYVVEEDEESTLVMANVKHALNIRLEPDSSSKKLGKLYKDCGGVILERGDGWTKIQSGNLVGWAYDEYLYFGEEAKAVAGDVGVTVAHMDSDLNVRVAAGIDQDVLGIIAENDVVDVVSVDEENGWVCIDYDGVDGYVSAEYVTIEFKIDHGETLEEIKEREAAEREAKRHVNYGQYTTDVDTTILLAALIQCEAGGESYEGQVAVGAVVLNRVRSGAYPDTIHGVIYASGQFTPACSGKLNRVLEAGNIKQSCLDAAEEALSGVSPVGDCTHFRRDNGTRTGIVIGHHVFY